MSALKPSTLSAAVDAYDAERMRLNDLWHGGKTPPMSDANKAGIAPMIAEAVLAALADRVPAAVTEEPEVERLPKIDPEFIVICQSAWANSTGTGINYDWDGSRFNNRNDAIKHGWKLRGSDDFNIAQTYGDDLIWFGWMDQRMDETEEDARDIAEAVGLTFDPRWYALDYAKVTGEVVGHRAALERKPE